MKYVLLKCAQHEQGAAATDASLAKSTVGLWLMNQPRERATVCECWLDPECRDTETETLRCLKQNKEHSDPISVMFTQA